MSRTRSWKSTRTCFRQARRRRGHCSVRGLERGGEPVCPDVVRGRYLLVDDFCWLRMGEVADDAVRRICGQVVDLGLPSHCFRLSSLERGGLIALLEKPLAAAGHARLSLNFRARSYSSHRTPRGSRAAKCSSRAAQRGLCTARCTSHAARRGSCASRCGSRTVQRGSRAVRFNSLAARSDSHERPAWCCSSGA